MVVLVGFAIGCSPVVAADKLHLVKVTGSGNDVVMDPRSLPQEMQKGYLAMQMFCESCHGQERMITTLRTGISPVTKLPYGEAEFDDKIIKIMRSPKSPLDRNNAKILTEFFHFLITKARLS
jgi:hypothetical protein